MKYEYENFYLNSKSLFDQIIDIWILNYYFQIQKLVFQFENLLIDHNNGHFYFEYFYLNMKLIFQLWKFFI
jgi:hypothetical protein